MKVNNDACTCMRSKIPVFVLDSQGPPRMRIGIQR